MNIWELSKMQAKELTIKYLDDFFSSNSFKLKKGSSSSFEYIKKHKAGFDSVAIGYLESFPGSQMQFTVIKRIDEVEKIKYEILAKVEPERKVDKTSSSLVFSIRTLEGLVHGRYMPEMLNEADVATSCEIVKDFMLKTGFPMLERFNDIKELDKEINGENFWTTDWQMPFNLGGDFDIKRVIIAWLANNPKFENIVQYHLKKFEELIATGEYVDLRKESLKQFEYAVEYLKQTEI